MTDGDIFQCARSDVTAERLDATAELGSGLRGGLEPVRWEMARLALGAAGKQGQLSLLGAASLLVGAIPRGPSPSGRGHQAASLLVGARGRPNGTKRRPGDVLVLL